MQKALKHLLFISRKPGSGSEHSKSKVEKNGIKHKKLKNKTKQNTNTVKIINKRAKLESNNIQWELALSASIKWTHTLTYVRIKSDEPTPHLEDWVESTVGSGDRRGSAL